jgi:hypothetical protein
VKILAKVLKKGKLFEITLEKQIIPKISPILCREMAKSRQKKTPLILGRL